MKILTYAAFIAFLSLKATAQTWDYVAVSQHGQKSGAWRTGHGTATVNLRRGKLQIDVTYEEAKVLGPVMQISGKISRDGTIHAMATYLATDQTPDKLIGLYRKRTSKQTWGNKVKLVTDEEIVFPYPQNWQFQAFRSQRVQDAK